MPTPKPIQEWVDTIIKGPEGFEAWMEENSIDEQEVTSEMVARWVLGCLADRRIPGGVPVLSKIIEHRAKKVTVPA